MRGNVKNLIPNSERTPEELREMTSKGGRASGEVRRRQRDMKTSMKYLLSLPASEQREIYEALGGCDDPTNQDIMLAALLTAAMTGDVSAIKQVREIARDDERLKYEKERLRIEKEYLKLKQENGGDALDKLDDILSKLDGDEK